MNVDTVRPPKATTFERSYPGEKKQVRSVRADLGPVVAGCPFADELILLASELSVNAVVHSRSGYLGGEFTVRAKLYPGDYAWVEVADQGGQWTGRTADDRPHGLDIVDAVAGGANWGIDGCPAYRVVWFRLDWPDGS